MHEQEDDDDEDDDARSLILCSLNYKLKLTQVQCIHYMTVLGLIPIV